MLTLILAESEMELVPEALRQHPSVSRPAKDKGSRPSRTILDSSLHHEAMKTIPEGDRRGRPDLVHFFLLLGLDSVLNQKGGLKLLVHTRHDELVTVDPTTRIMRNYPRFIGLMEQLLREGHVPKAKPLMTVEPGWTLERVISEHAKGRKVLLTEKADVRAPAEFVHELFAKGSGEATVILGGFPKGDFRSDVSKLVDERVAFTPEALTVWIVEMELLAHWETAAGTFRSA